MAKPKEDTFTDIEVAHPVIPEWYSKENKRMVFGLRNIAEKVVKACIVRYGAQDLLLHVWMSGVYHGATLERQRHEGSTN